MEYKKLDNIFVVGLCGRSCSGKSFFAREIKERLEHYISMNDKKTNVVVLSMARAVKDIAYRFGWNGKKDKKGRELLIGIGNNVGRRYNNNIWVDKLYSKLDKLNSYDIDTIIIIDDIRYYNETALCNMLIKIDIPFYKKIRQFFEPWRWSKSERGLWLNKVDPSIRTISTVNNKKEDYADFKTEWLVMQINNERNKRSNI